MRGGNLINIFDSQNCNRERIFSSFLDLSKDSFNIQHIFSFDNFAFACKFFCSLACFFSLWHEAKISIFILIWYIHMWNEWGKIIKFRNVAYHYRLCVEWRKNEKKEKKSRRWNCSQIYFLNWVFLWSSDGQIVHFLMGFLIGSGKVDLF